MKSIIEGQRLAFWLSKTDVSLNHDNETIRKEADEMVSLIHLDRVFFSDMGVEITVYPGFWWIWLHKRSRY